jgi:hypothetical protein
MGRADWGRIRAEGVVEGARRACGDQKVRPRRPAVVLTCHARVPILGGDVVCWRGDGHRTVRFGVEIRFGAPNT